MAASEAMWLRIRLYTSDEGLTTWRPPFMKPKGPTEGSAPVVWAMSGVEC